MRNTLGKTIFIDIVECLGINVPPVPPVLKYYIYRKGYSLFPENSLLANNPKRYKINFFILVNVIIR